MAEIQNPNQQGGEGGGDSRSLFTMMVIFVAAILAFQYFAPKKAQEPEHPQQKTQQPAQKGAAGAPAAAGTSGETGSAGAPASQGKAAPAANTVEATGESTTVVENELYRITFTNRGGLVKSWVLKKYKGDDEKTPLDLVNQEAAAKFGLPLSLYTYDATLKARLNSALYVPSATGTLTAPGTLSFEYSDGGLTVHKTFHFDASYVIQADVTVTENGAPVTALVQWPSGLGDETSAAQYARSTFDQLESGKSSQVAAKKVADGETLHGNFDYAGVSDLYFAAIFMPETPADTSVVTLHETMNAPRSYTAPKGGGTVNGGETSPSPVLGAAVGANAGIHTRLFAGPKLLGLLESVHTASGDSLEHVVNFGWWSWIAKPMLLVLRFFVNHGISNWGWAILVLTLILNVAMLPTRIMMMKSQIKMQRIQPQMDAIKAKYAKYKATDPRRQEMNKEMFDLQRKEGVNMFGGCLPMLLQYPLLIGFYEMLEYAIELRQAHWLWLPDLSAPDPTHVLPVFFVVSMFLSQFFTPSPGMDQRQQRMMAFMMPAIFGFMVWNMGSGVALYWAGSNLLGVGLQFAMNRTGMGQEMRAIAARRAAKRGGKR